MSTLGGTLLTSLSLIAALLSWSAPAHATTGLAWEWGASDKRFLLHSDVELPEALWFRASQNTDVRVVSFTMDLLTRCSAERPVGKRGWELVCAIDDVRIAATAYGPDAGKLLPILDEMDAKLLGGTVQVTFLADGRVRRVDLEGVDKRNRRLEAIHETLRQLLVRNFAGLDLQLPKKGDDRKKGAWTQVTPLAVTLPSNTAALGKVVVEHRIASSEGGTVRLESSGRGTIGAGDTMAIEGQETPLNMFSMIYEGSAAFDTTAGRLVERVYAVRGTPTASSMVSEAGQGGQYIQRVAAIYIPDDEVVPDLGANEERLP